MTEYSGQPNIRLDGMVSARGSVNKFGMSRKRGPYKNRRFVRGFKPTPPGWPKVVEWRFYKDWTQEELSEMSGLSVGTISDLQTQEVGFGQETLESLARAFQCSIGALFDVDPNEDPDWWQLWSNAQPPQKEQIIAYTQGLLNRKP